MGSVPHAITKDCFERNAGILGENECRGVVGESHPTQHTGMRIHIRSIYTGSTVYSSTVDIVYINTKGKP